MQWLCEIFNLTWTNNDPTASGYKLYRGVNGSTATRTFLPPNHSAATGTFSDTSVILGTSYNYWLTSYKIIYTPASTEVTSNDENGNPTGFIDYPAFYTDVEAPFSGSSLGKTPTACNVIVTPPIQPVNPTINLFLNNQPSNSCQRKCPVTIRWEVSNATDCTASSYMLSSSLKHVIKLNQNFLSKDGLCEFIECYLKLLDFVEKIDLGIRVILRLTRIKPKWIKVVFVKLL